MKSNFISVGKVKKKPYKIVIDHDKTLEEFDVNKFNEAVERMVNRTQASATEMANAGWAFHFMAQRLRARRLEREAFHNVVDEVAEPRPSYIDQLIDIVKEGL